MKMISDNFHESIYKLYPNVVSTLGDKAYDANGDEVIYDLQAVTEEAQKETCKKKAKQLLVLSDWSALPDVGLINSAEFVTYRGILRGYVIQPVVSPNFPIEPTPIWV
jgi:hypothetical protein